MIVTKPKCTIIFQLKDNSAIKLEIFYQLKEYTRRKLTIEGKIIKITAFGAAFQVL